jgi:uncharacterized membrane protein
LRPRATRSDWIATAVRTLKVAAEKAEDDNRARLGRHRSHGAEQQINEQGIVMNQVTTDPPSAMDTKTDTAKIIYILYLVSLATGITAVVGVVLAYVKRDEASQWLQTHYRFQIRTFWIGLLYCVLGVILSMVLIGFLVLLFLAVWLIIRVIKGFKHLERREPVPNYDTWMF